MGHIPALIMYCRRTPEISNLTNVIQLIHCLKFWKVGEL